MTRHARASGRTSNVAVRVRMPQAALCEPGRSGSMLVGFTSHWDQPASSTCHPARTSPADDVLVHSIGALREQHARTNRTVELRLQSPRAGSVGISILFRHPLRPGSPPGLRRVGEAGKDEVVEEAEGRLRRTHPQRHRGSNAGCRRRGACRMITPQAGADDSSGLHRMAGHRVRRNGTLFVGLLQPGHLVDGGRRRRSRNGARLRGTTRKADGGGLLFQGSNAGVIPGMVLSKPRRWWGPLALGPAATTDRWWWRSPRRIVSPGRCEARRMDLRFAPVVGIDGVDSLLLDIRGCERWMAARGGRRGCSIASGIVPSQGFDAQVAIADTVPAARAWCRHARGKGLGDRVLRPDTASHPSTDCRSKGSAWIP